MSGLTAGLTGAESSVLLVLAAVAEPVRNPDLTLLGPALSAPSRAKLQRAGLIDVQVGSRRALVLSLTDRGWAAAAQVLESDPPAKSSGATRALFTFGASVGRYLRRESLALGEITVPTSSTEDPPTDPNEPDVVELVRGAYRRLAPRPAAWVGLRQLRAALPDVPRDAVDAALAALYPEPDVDIVAEDNRKALTDDDRAAALHLGGRPLHAIRVAT